MTVSPDITMASPDVPAAIRSASAVDRAPLSAFFRSRRR